MEFRVTNVSASENSMKMISVAKRMEEYLVTRLQAGGYGGGVETFLGVLVSAFSEADELAVWSKSNTRVSSPRDFLTNKPVRTLSVGVPINFELTIQSTHEYLVVLAHELLLSALRTPQFRVPKGFDLAGLIADLEVATPPPLT